MSGKRFVTIAEYSRLSGLSYPTIKAALERGDLRGVRTEANFWKIDLQAESSPDMAAIAEQLDEQGRLLRALCGHLGVAQ